MTLSTGDPTYLARTTLSAAALMLEHPPRITNPNKALVYDLSCAPGAVHRGELVASRYIAAGIPADVSASPPTVLEARADLFQYGPAASDALEWHLNFADSRLFVAYGSGLLAQDELQVLEHPALGALCEHVNALGDPVLRPFTRGDEGVPTPWLVRGVERRCALATDIDVDEGRVYGLYGNRFARAKPDVVRRSVRVLDPPTVSNILALHAIPGGRGVYSLAEIHDVVATAYTGFAAARGEAREVGAARAVVHTGHWGTGAYGGNRVLMALLQLISARLAGLDALVFHAFDTAGMGPYRQAARLLDEVVWPRGVAEGTAAMLQGVHALGFEWGSSDGN